MTVVTRFPPSPTGFMHIGNARTALYNWLYARHHNGKFLLRIEDTDRQRHSDAAVQAILDGLHWLGLEWDGDAVSQFARPDRHAEVAEDMIAKGQAYYCYCSEEELDEMREEAKAEGRPVYYDRRWRDRNPAEDAPHGRNPVVRIKAPLEGETVIHDRVLGTITINNEQIDDFIILRSDGTPTYMLSVVVDDHDMGITHVIRGDDHMNNAFRQKVIYDAMGWDVPVHAHLPLIHGPDGKKFSKRHGAESVDEYREMGYMADAMINYLLRLGWSHGNEEIISRKQAIEWFNLDHVGQSPARFDFAKLDSLNAHYIKEADNDDLYAQILPFLKEQEDVKVTDTTKEHILQSMDELKGRAKSLVQIAEEAAFYGKKAPFDYDEKAQSLINADTKPILSALKSGLESLESFDTDAVQGLCKDIAKEHANGQLGKVGMPFRAALTGRTASPSIFHAAAILGKDEVLARLKVALKRVNA